MLIPNFTPHSCYLLLHMHANNKWLSISLEPAANSAERLQFLIKILTLLLCFSCQVQVFYVSVPLAWNAPWSHQVTKLLWCQKLWVQKYVLLLFKGKKECCTHKYLWSYCKTSSNKLIHFHKHNMNPLEVCMSAFLTKTPCCRG